MQVPEVAPPGLRGILSGKRSLRSILGSRDRPGIPTVMVEAFNVMQDRIMRARLAGDPPDVQIAPRLGAVGWFDFQRGAEAIALGAEATKKALETIDEAIAALSHPAGPTEAAK